MLVVCVLGGMIAWATLAPSRPKFSADYNAENVIGADPATRENCQPEQLSKMRSGIKREEKRDECANESQNYKTEEATLQQQTWATEASQQSVLSAWQNNRLYLAQTILLGMTLIAAAAGAIATSNAARAAESAIKDIERAYLVPGFIDKSAQDGGVKPLLTVKNFGKTPGIIKHIRVKFFSENPDSPHDEIVGIDKPTDLIIAGGDKFEFGELDLVSNDNTGFVACEIIYKDIIGFDFIARVCFKFERDVANNTLMYTAVVDDVYWNCWT